MHCNLPPRNYEEKKIMMFLKNIQTNSIGMSTSRQRQLAGREIERDTKYAI